MLYANQPFQTDRQLFRRPWTHLQMLVVIIANSLNKTVFKSRRTKFTFCPVSSSYIHHCSVILAHRPLNVVRSIFVPCRLNSYLWMCLCANGGQPCYRKLLVFLRE